MLGILNSLHECSELSTRCRQLAIRPYDYLASGFCPRAIYPDSELSRTAAQAFFRLSGQNTAFLANTARFHCLAGRVSSMYSAHFWVFRAGFWPERSERSRVPPGSKLCIGHIKAPPVVQAGIVFTRKIGGFAGQWTFILRPPWLLPCGVRVSARHC